jgi:hypothetical protein
MSDINRVVIAHWKLKKWFDSRNFSKIMVAESALNQIDIYLKKQQIEVIDLTGSRYDLGLSVDVLATDTDLSEFETKNFYIGEMTRPIIMSKGVVSEYGEVKLTTKNPLDNQIQVDSVQGEAVNQSNAKKMHEENDKRKLQLHSSKRLSMISFSFVVIILLLTLSNVLTSIKLSAVIGDQDSRIESILLELENIANLSKKQEDLLRDLEINNLAITSLLEQQKLKNNTIFDQYGNQLSFIYHKVQKGESLISICNRYGINYQISRKLIQAINGLDSNDLISIGQIVVLPKEKTHD